MRYSRLNPRIALLEGEEGSDQIFDMRLYPGVITTMEYPLLELVPGAIVLILLALIGIGLLLFSQELVGKIAGLCFAVFTGSLAWYLITMNSRAQRKRKQEIDDFINTNISTQAKVLSIVQSLSQLTIQFTVLGRSAPVAQTTLVVNTDHSLIQNIRAGDYITVRYSPNNPRVLLIEGEQ